MITSCLLRTSGTVLALAGLLLSGCAVGGDGDTAAASSDSPAALRPYYEQRLTWRGCGPEGFQCATMKVPLDYAKPDAAEDLQLSVARQKATDQDRRLGSLLVNPGGPGGSAIDYLTYAALGYPEPVTSRYDMAAFDPRGVARSEPVECLSDREMDVYVATDATPDDAAETSELVAANKGFAEGCEKREGELLEHVSTVEAARDMDVFRALLGDEELTYVGKSYGTFLGATYAELFPARVGRFVLDGALDPSVSALEGSRGQADGFEVAFDSFAEDCLRQAACPLGDDPGTALEQLFEELDARPLPAGGSRELGESLATTGVIAAMYDEGAWPTLREALAQAERGDGSGLLALSDTYYERDEDGGYSNLMYANAAVNCLDLPPALESPADVEATLPSFHEASPHFGTTLAWASLLCGSWPEEATGRAHRIEAEGAAPILVVGTTRDPATPYAWSVSLAEQLSSGVLLTYEGDGHTAYARGSDCVDTAVDRYLLDGEVPADGKKCS